MHIAYYTMGPRSFASSRLRAYAVGDVLEQLGHMVRYNPSNPFRHDIVVVQKCTDLVDVMRQCRRKGIFVVWDVCDHQPGPVHEADVVTVSTRALLELYPQAVVVPDCLDVPRDALRKTEHRDDLRRIVWFGNPENAYQTRPVAEACARLGLELVLITDPANPFVREVGGAVIPWRLDTIDRELIAMDLVVCPYVLDGRWPAEWVRSKSPNRALKAWGLGLPVAATAIPSYTEIGVRYTAATTAEWVEVLRQLRPAAVRRADAERGHAIAQAYQAEVIARQWLSVFAPARVNWRWRFAFRVPGSGRAARLGQRLLRWARGAGTAASADTAALS
jgi:hypothetical protein